MRKTKTERPSIPGLIGAALKVEHYEIARYHTALNITKAMGLSDVTGLLRENLNEEVAAAKEILVLAHRIFAGAPTTFGEEGNDFETKKDQEEDRTSNDDERAGAAKLKKDEA